MTQYFDGKATAADAEPVAVRAAQVSGGVDAAMEQPEVPHNVVPPETSGIGKVGETLTCDEGDWRGYPHPFTYEYSWYRDGTPIADAEATAYKLGAEDTGHTVSCGVAAGNSLGTAPVTPASASIAVAPIRELKLFPGGNGFGSLTVSPQGVTCSSTCTVDANEGETVTITATPVAHYEFTGWTFGPCAGKTGPCEVTLGSTYVLIQSGWARITHPVSVGVTGHGSVSASSGAISGCTESGGTCSGPYEEGRTAFLIASPNPHYEATDWTGCERVVGNECWVSVEGAASVTVNFVPIARQLNVSEAGNGSGTVTDASGAIECGSSCTGSGYDGEVVILTATPAAHSEFTGWSGGGCSGTGATCETTLGPDSNITATFAKISHPVSVTVHGSGSVIDPLTGHIACEEAAGTCSAAYEEGAEVTLTARPNSFQPLSGWTGCTSESGDECQVAVDAAAQVTATFVPVLHQVSVTRSGTGSGTVTSSPTGFACGATCTPAFQEGQGVLLTAAPDPGSEFVGWSGGCAGTGRACIVLVLEDKTVVANFAARPSSGGGSTGSGETPAPAVAPAPTIAPPAPTVPSIPTPAPTGTAKKPLKCKKGFRRVAQKGKARCVKAKAKAKSKHR